ncbi:MAG: hypothetical protein ACO3EH_00360 [Ilumatobacteraceae bacterium]
MTTITTYRAFYSRPEDAGSGYSFECDANGHVDEATLSPIARESLACCRVGRDERGTLVGPKIQEHVRRVRICGCGSGEEAWITRDARGIPLGYVCSKCKKAKLAKYDWEILTNPNYYSDEPIDPQ